MATRRRLTSVLLVSPLLFPLLCAEAQNSAQANPAPAQQTQNAQNFALEEIIVTANRRAQSLQEVPMSVSAFTSEFFKNAGVNDLAGLEQYTPSLKITPGTDSRSTSIRIRGIGSVGTNVGIDPSVGMFIDGVYQGRAGMSISDLIDVERVEVLRGPQGTLYGKNTAAGAISIITKQPSAEFEYETELVYTSDERLEVRGMVNIPFGESGHAMRITGFGIDGDHLFENKFTGEGVNDANKKGIKFRTLFDAQDAGEFLVTVDYTKEDTDCCALGVINYSGLSTLNAPGTNSPSQELQQELGLNVNGNPILQFLSFEDLEGFAPPPADPFGNDYFFNADTFNEIEVGGVSVEWNLDLDNESTITFINAWRYYDQASAFDGDFGPYDAVYGDSEIELDQYSSELRLTSPGGETFDYQGGLYAYYSKLDSEGITAQTPKLTDRLGLIGTIFPAGTENLDTNEYQTTSFAAFGQVVWNITDEFSATLGLRYTTEKKERVGSQLTFPESIIDIPPVAGPDVFYDESRTDDDISPSINLRYFVTPEIMTYASVSRGFKSGGYNQRRELQGLNGEFDEEIATNYELGWKASSEDRRLTFNGTFYYVEYEDFQAQAFDGSSIRVTNAGSMESYGSEIEIVYVPTADLTLSTAIGYNKAEYKEFENGQCTVEETFRRFFIEMGRQGGQPGTGFVCTQDLAGQAIDNAPEWTVSSFLQYDKPLGDDLLAIGRVEHSYTDEFFLDQDLDPNLKNDAVHLLNLRLTLTNADNTWEVGLWGRNLLDEEYFGFGIDIPVLGGYAGVVAPEETYGITVRFRN